MKKLLYILFLLVPGLVCAQMQAVPSVASSHQVKGTPSTIIRSLDAEFNKFQRHNVPFTITNTSVGAGMFAWQILDLTTNSPALISYDRQPTVSLPIGYYVLFGHVQGLNDDPVERIFYHKQITVLPTLKSEGEATRVLTLGTGNNIYDASSWSAGETIFLKKSGASVGRIRINNYNSSSSRAHLIIDPSSEMEVNAFAGSSGLYLVNCQGLLIDAVGTTDAYGLYLNGVGDNTSHGIVINTTTDVRCEGIEIYGVKIEVPQSGASGLRMLMDESATYNRTLPSLKKFRFAHIWVVESGHEGMYLGVSEDADTGNGGPRESEDVWGWDWIVDDSGRDAMQPCETINSVFHDWVINASGTLGESSHNSYIVHNAGNQNIKIFNVRAKGGRHGISMKFGETGSNPMIWNVTMEVIDLGAAQSAWNFIQVGDAPNTDITIANVTLVANSGDEIPYRLDSSVGQGTQDIDDFTLINCATIKGSSANFFTKDGTNAETNWDRTSGNLTYTPATSSSAMLDAITHLPSSVSSPSISGGVSWTTRRSYADLLGDFGSLEVQYDIDGYVITDGQYPSGAGAGVTLKLAAL